MTLHFLNDVTNDAESIQKLAIQQTFSKPCPVNLILKDTHLVFSIYHIRVLVYVISTIIRMDCSKYRVVSY